MICIAGVVHPKAVRFENFLSVILPVLSRVFQVELTLIFHGVAEEKVQSFARRVAGNQLCVEIVHYRALPKSCSISEVRSQLYNLLSSMVSDFVCFADFDDDHLSSRFVRAFDILEDYDFCSSNLLIVDQNTRLKSSELLSSDEYRSLDATDLLDQNFFGFGVSGFKKAVIPYLVDQAKVLSGSSFIAHDWYCYLALRRAGFSFWLDPNVGCKYYVARGSLTNSLEDLCENKYRRGLLQKMMLLELMNDYSWESGDFRIENCEITCRLNRVREILQHSDLFYEMLAYAQRRKSSVLWWEQYVIF